MRRRGRKPEPHWFRPTPPEELIQRGAERFSPAREVEQWFREVVFDYAGPLYNPDHSHLEEARIGVVWTNAENEQGMRPVAGTAELINLNGRRWSKARQRYQLDQWFGGWFEGELPDFLITLDAVCAYTMTDIEFCALVEHELYHCGHKRDRYGEEMYGFDERPVFALRGHDVEEHLGIVERYGMVGANVRRLVEIAGRKPTIAPAEISWACGTCLQRAA